MRNTIPAAWRSQMHHPWRSALGAALAIALTAWSSRLAMHWLAAEQVPGLGAQTPFLVASLGASAVLAFAVPASPLAQPRAVLGGNVISALAGIAAQRIMGAPVLAAGLAVGLAIAAMYLARCLHPPGGGLALITAMAPPPVRDAGLLFVALPVALNSALLVGAAMAWNTLSGSRYPHRPEAAPPMPPAHAMATREDIAAVLDGLEDLPDVSLDDLEMILRAAQGRALDRARG